MCNFSPPEIPSISLNKDVFATKIAVLRDGKTTKGLQMNIFMHGAEKAYQFDSREYRDVDVLYDDTCQVFDYFVWCFFLKIFKCALF